MNQRFGRQFRFLALFALTLAIWLFNQGGWAHAQGLPCPLFPRDNIWNVRVDNLPVHPRSADYVNRIGATRNLHPDFGSGFWPPGSNSPIGIPFVVVPGSQPRVNVTFRWADESDPGPYPIPRNAPIEGGPDGRGDRHVLVLNRDTCHLYELYNAWPMPNGSWRADSGAKFNLRGNALRPRGWTSADAAGLPILPGLLRYDVVASGTVTHAIRFTASRTQRAYVWPARHHASTITDPTYPPMGQRFRLKAGYDISGFSPMVQVILRAFKTYGIILADNGSDWFISGAPDERWNNAVLRELRRVPGSAFEAVDVSSLMINPDSGQARTRGAGTLRVIIEPAAARTAGARWRREGDTPWRPHGFVQRLAPGVHRVAFRPLPGWRTPAARRTVVRQNQMTTVSVTYQAVTANCPTRPVGWLNTCMGIAPAAVNTAVRTVANTRPLYTGNATFRCANGNWVLQPGTATCRPMIPTPCPSQTVTWLSNCAGIAPVAGHAAVRTVTNTRLAYTGSANYQCTHGNWALQPNKATCRPTWQQPEVRITSGYLSSKLHGAWATRVDKVRAGDRIFGVYKASVQGNMASLQGTHSISEFNVTRGFHDFYGIGDHAFSHGFEVPEHFAKHDATYLMRFSLCPEQQPCLSRHQRFKVERYGIVDSTRAYQKEITGRTQKNVLADMNHVNAKLNATSIGYDSRRFKYTLKSSDFLVYLRVFRPNVVLIHAHGNAAHGGTIAFGDFYGNPQGLTFLHAPALAASDFTAPGGLFYAAICKGAEQDGLGRAFLNKGYKAFISYRATVYTDRNRQFYRTFFDHATKYDIPIHYALELAKNMARKKNWNDVMTARIIGSGNVYVGGARLDAPRAGMQTLTPSPDAEFVPWRAVSAMPELSATQRSAVNTAGEMVAVQGLKQQYGARLVAGIEEFPDCLRIGYQVDGIFLYGVDVDRKTGQVVDQGPLG